MVSFYSVFDVLDDGSGGGDWTIVDGCSKMEVLAKTPISIFSNFTVSNRRGFRWDICGHLFGTNDDSGKIVLFNGQNI